MDNRQTATEMPQTLIGRADLLRALAVGDAEADAVADSLGMIRKPTPARQPDVKLDTLVGQRTLGSVSAVAWDLPKASNLPFWRVEAANFFEPLGSGSRDDVSESAQSGRPKPVTEKDINDYNVRKTPRPRPIVPWSRVWPAISHLWKGKAGRGPVDLERLVDRWSRVEWLSTLPRKAALSGTVLRVYVDRSRRLVPFWADQRMILDKLEKHLGPRRVVLHWCVHGLEATGQWLEGGARVPPLCSGDVVLALTDLGLYGIDADRTRWQQLAKRLKKKGAVLTALLPVPKNRWHSRYCSGWIPVDWADPRNSGRGHREAPSRSSLNDNAERLLKLLCYTLRIEPGLLRELRGMLPTSIADIGTEADAWAHPKFLGGSSQGKWIDPATAKNWRAEYLSLTDEHRQKALDALRRWHERREYGLFESELTALAVECGQPGLDEKELAEARRCVRSILAAMPEQGGAGKSMGRMVAGWVDHFDSWVGKAVREDPELGPELTYAKHKADLRPEKDREWNWWQLRQSEGGFVLNAASEGDGKGGLVVEFESKTPMIKMFSKAEQQFGSEILRLPENQPARIPESPQVELIGDGFHFLLKQFTKPYWAQEIGRDRLGLFMRLDDSQIYRWWNPGRYVEAGDREAERQGLITSHITYSCGFWVPEWVVQNWLKNRKDSACRSDVTRLRLYEDHLGLYNDVPIHGIVQRFRWIPPGTFLMGSPEDEPERQESETQHEVELTQGFWLADTACTQQLWQAVMGENPSNFQGEDLPVEQVSWDDCNSFFEKVNSKMSGLNLRFPTEAEWEYACRAGTSTPFSFGENITTEQVNYDGNYPYLGGAKGAYREKTVPVKAPRPNPWGLYQMHGNVYEWCEDWYNGYPTGRVVDPRVSQESESRVLRGGSWSGYGGWCRSAGRDGARPGLRYVFLGFRLSRGPVEPGTGRAEPRGAGQSEVERSGTGDAPRKESVLYRITKGLFNKK